MNEIWMPVKGYEQLYDVSSMGNVRRKRKTNSGEIGSLLKTVTDKLGYKRVCLCKDGTAIRHLVHRVVASAFIPGYGRDVNHINGNTSDNRVSNLEWCSHQENMKKAAETGLIKCNPVRQKHKGEEVAVFPSLCEASRLTGFHKSNISKCCQGKRKTANGFEWEWIKDEGGNTHDTD